MAAVPGQLSQEVRPTASCAENRLVGRTSSCEAEVDEERRALPALRDRDESGHESVHRLLDELSRSPPAQVVP